MEDSDGIKPSKERLKRILHDVALERCCVDQVVDHQGNTLLHLAVLLECDEIINRLLLCGANPRIFNHDGFSAIQLAENMGAQSSIKIFDKWDRFHKLITTNDFCAIKDIPLESSTILYCSRYLAVFEDYVDWTTASRRFRVKVNN